MWHFTCEGEEVSVPVQGNISANEASTLLSATLAGAGISLLPSYQAGVFVQRGELVRLLPEAEPRLMNIYAVYASRKHMPASLRSMLDFLAERFTDEPVWDKDL